MPIDRLRVRAVIIVTSLVFSALLLVLSATPAHAEMLPPENKLARELVANEQAAWDKYAKRDLEGSRPLLAADYADVQTDGSVLDRNGHLAFVPEAKTEWFELDRFHVFRLSDDAAVVTYRARARDKGSSDLYIADVTAGWSRRGKRWVATFYRETPTPPEKKPAAD